MAPDDLGEVGIDLEARAAQLVMRIERAEDIAFVVGGEETVLRRSDSSRAGG